MAKVGRNEPCPCGSGQKYKKCHGSNDNFQVVSSFENHSMQQVSHVLNQSLNKIREEKRLNTRAKPSSTLICLGDGAPDIDIRQYIVDECARLVDQNWAGRSEMCIYFAVLVREALSVLNIVSTVEIGRAHYQMEGASFEWKHAWVKTANGDVIDGNADSMSENPLIPPKIKPRPYWGPETNLPKDRRLSTERVLLPTHDENEMTIDEIRPWKIAIRDYMNHLSYK